MAQEEPVNITPKESTGQKSLRIRLGRVDSVDLYEIKDNELDLLEKGSPAGLYLNFAVFLLSIAFTALATLCTTTSFKSAILQTVFVVVVVVGFLVGFLLLILWRRGRKDIAKVIREIRNRIPPEPSAGPSLAPDMAISPDEQPKPVQPKK